MDYELTVRGRLGPTTRAALAGGRFDTVESGTIIRVEETRDRGLVEVIRLLESAEVTVSEVHEIHAARPTRVVST